MPSDELEEQLKVTFDNIFLEINGYLNILEEIKFHFSDQITSRKDPLVSLSQKLKKQFNYVITTDTFIQSPSPPSPMGTGVKFVPFTLLQSSKSQVRTQEYESIKKEVPTAIFVFISPCWYRNYEGIKEVPATNGVLKSIILSVEQVIKSSSYSDCYLWLHSECVDSNCDVTHSLMSIYRAIEVCDVVITPVDADAPDWSADCMSFAEFPCDQWNGCTHSLT